MIVVFKHEDMSSTHQGKFYPSMAMFALDTFKILINDEGQLSIDGDISSVSYDLDVWKKGEAINNYVNSDMFKSYARTHFYIVYLIKDKLI